MKGLTAKTITKLALLNKGGSRGLQIFLGGGGGGGWDIYIYSSQT